MRQTPPTDLTSVRLWSTVGSERRTSRRLPARHDHGRIAPADALGFLGLHVKTVEVDDAASNA